MNPIGFLKQLCPELHRRADAAGMTRPCELGLVLDGEKYRLVVSRRSVKLGPASHRPQLPGLQRR